MLPPQSFSLWGFDVPLLVCLIISRLSRIPEASTSLCYGDVRRFLLLVQLCLRRALVLALASCSSFGSVRETWIPLTRGVGGWFGPFREFPTFWATD